MPWPKDKLYTHTYTHTHTHTQANTVVWSSDANRQLIGKVPDSGKD